MCLPPVAPFAADVVAGALARGGGGAFVGGGGLGGVGEGRDAAEDDEVLVPQKSVSDVCVIHVT